MGTLNDSLNKANVSRPNAVSRICNISVVEKKDASEIFQPLLPYPKRDIYWFVDLLTINAHRLDAFFEKSTKGSEMMIERCMCMYLIPNPPETLGRP